MNVAVYGDVGIDGEGCGGGAHIFSSDAHEASFDRSLGAGARSEKSSQDEQ